jgi:hypothetical protein
VPEADVRGGDRHDGDAGEAAEDGVELVGEVAALVADRRGPRQPAPSVRGGRSCRGRVVLLDAVRLGQLWLVVRGRRGRRARDAVEDGHGQQAGEDQRNERARADHEQQLLGQRGDGLGRRHVDVLESQVHDGAADELDERGGSRRGGEHLEPCLPGSDSPGPPWRSA